MNTTKMAMNTDSAWLRRMAELEDGSPVSAGGWVHALEEAQGPSVIARMSRLAFSQLIILARRERDFSRSEFAMQADIALTELVRIETEPDYTPSPRAVYQIAEFLELPHGELNALAGLTMVSDKELAGLACQFAARSTPGEAFTGDDREALELFVRYLLSREKQAS